MHIWQSSYLCQETTKDKKVVKLGMAVTEVEEEDTVGRASRKTKIRAATAIENNGRKKMMIYLPIFYLLFTFHLDN